MKNIYRHIILIAVLFIAACTLHAQIPAERYAPNFAADNPYGLVDLDHFDLGDYSYCRWGLLQDRFHAYINGMPAVLGFTPLTQGPFTFDGNTDLFISNSLTDFTNWNLSHYDSGEWIPPGSAGTPLDPTNKNGYIKFPASGNKTYYLFRKLHFPDQLKGKIFSEALPNDAKKVIVLIHGWNPDGKDYHYSNEFNELYENLRSELINTGWHVVLYRWEADADTGPVNISKTNPTEAATISHLHGQHLGQLLSGFNHLEKVHFIAHSAGTWAARSATRYLLQNTTKRTQITLLDAFIPGEIEENGTPLTSIQMNNTYSFQSQKDDQLFYLENIFAIDVDGSTSSWSDAYHAATSVWLPNWHHPSKGWNQRVDMSPEGTQTSQQAEFYDWHSGPITFYTDTIRKFGRLNLSIPGLKNKNFDLERVGWRRSLFYNEPVVDPLPPSVVETMDGGKTLTSKAHLRGSATATTDILCEWEVSSEGPETGFTFFRVTGNLPALQLSNAEVNAGQRWFRLVAQNDAGLATGKPVEVIPNTPPGGSAPRPTSAPAAPSNLVARAVSSSQINLTWQTNSTNQTGYKLQRKPDGGVWKDIDATIQGTAFSNTAGLSPNTRYFYRVRAFNSSGHSTHSNEASNTTFPGSGATCNLTITSSNPNGGVSVASMIGTSNYQSATTPANRAFAAGTLVTVTCPLTLTSGQVFQKWQLNGVDHDWDEVATVTMSTAQTLTAIYGSNAPSLRTPATLVIEGPSSVDENSSTLYRAKVTYSDGATAYVNASWEETSSHADISGSGRLDTESVTSNKSIAIAATYTAGGVTKVAGKTVTIRDSSPAQTYTLTLNATNGHITPSPRATHFATGTVVSLTAYPDDGFVRTGWSGDASGNERTITVRMDKNRAVTAHFAEDTREASVRVTIRPEEAASGGAGWKIKGKISSVNWQPSGDTYRNLKPGSAQILFKDIPGWVTPENIPITLAGGANPTEVSGLYREIKGAVQVTIHPPQAREAGARWRLNGGAWQESGATQPEAPTGENLVEYLAIPGWSKPAAQTIAVQRGFTSVVEVGYAPPAGFPIVNSVSPKTGPIEGGTVVTLEGANFQPGATVTFDGIAATAVTVVNSATITAVTPPRASYGTVQIAVTSAGQKVTLAGGFTYDVPVGVNMTLISQIGGSVHAVATGPSGMVYYGEGNSIVAADYSNPSIPIIRGRLALGGIVKGIQISGDLAVIAADQAGLQVVNVSNPSAMARDGFYITPRKSLRLALSGRLAFVAGAEAGLQVIDFSDPKSPTHLADFDLPESAGDIELAQIGTRRIALIACGFAGLQLLDVTEPRSIAFIGSLKSGFFIDKVDVKGSLVRFREFLFDISNPEHPAQLSDNLSQIGDAVIGSEHVYIGMGTLQIYQLSDFLNRPAEIYSHDLELPGDTMDMQLRGTTLFLANNQGGLIAVNVANTSSPTVLSATDSSFKASDVKWSGGTLYAAADDGAPLLAVISTASLTSPQRIGIARATKGLQRIECVGSRVYSTSGVSSGSSLFNIQDIQNPSQSALVCTDRYTEDVTLLNGNPLIGGGTKTTPLRPLLTVLNASAPPTTAPLASFQLSSSAGRVSAVTVSGNHVFSATATSDNSSTFRITDFSNLASPQTVGSLDITGSTNDAALSEDGRHAFLANINGGLSIIDCRIKTSPQLLVTYSRNSVTSGTCVAVSGNLVFYGDRRGINVLDCSEPLNPRLVAFYDTPGLPSGIAVNGDKVFVADDTAGIEILRLDDINRPLVEITQPTRNPALETTSPTLSLQGSSSDAQGVTRVTWKNDRGGGGVAQGTGTWTITDIQLAAGANVVTVTAEDGHGNLAHTSITVNAALPETHGPAILITGPKPPPAFAHATDLLPLTGTAADASGVQSVIWTNHRGGSGTASGTSAWSAEVQLFNGPNHITLTAIDTLGNTSQAVVLVNYQPPDSIPPSAEITFPTDQQLFTTHEPSINLAGEAGDDRSVARVTWQNNRGGSGVATGTREWHANEILLQNGMNVITVAAEDLAGNTSFDNLAVIFTPTAASPASPALSVQTPPPTKPKPFITELSTLDCTGQASGSSTLAEVVVSLNNGPWLGAVGIGNWAAQVTLTPGLNILRFKAIDVEGRESPILERHVFYRRIALLTLATRGEGTISLSGKPDPEAMEAGRLYTAEAKPARDWVFVRWEGASVSSSRHVSFVMKEGASLTAIFIENPYPDAAAAYRGLLQTEPPDPTTSGAASLTLTKSGAFTGLFTIGSKRLPLKGIFDGSGTFLGQLNAGREIRYDVLLNLDTATAGAPITGLFGSGSLTMAFNAWPVIKFPNHAPATEAGHYKVAIEPGGEVGAPIGYGVGHMTVQKSGIVNIATRLANGTRTTFASALTAGHRAPVYNTTDGGKSSFSAALVFDEKPDSSVDAIAFWSSSRERSKSHSFNPFQSEPRIFAQRHVPPSKNERALASLEATHGSASLFLENEDLSLAQTLNLGIDNKFTPADPVLRDFKIVLHPARGEFTGSLFLNTHGKRASFSGVLLNQSGEGVGLLLMEDLQLKIRLSPLRDTETQ